MRHLQRVRHLVLRVLCAGAALVCIGSRAHAFVELNGFYFSDGLTTATTATTTRMFVDAAVGFGIDKADRYQVGWNYSMMSTTDATTTTKTYSATHMGPRFIFSFDKAHTWSIGVGYYLVSNASYSDGAGGSFTWKGTTIKGDLGYNLPITENFLMGLRLNYSMATWTEQLVGSTTYSTVSYSKTAMYPSVYSIYMF